jgi:hypothetical protein
VIEMYFRASGMRAQTCAKLLEQVPSYITAVLFLRPLSRCSS